MTELRDELWLRSPTGILQIADARVTDVEWWLDENAFGKLVASGPLVDAAFADAKDITPDLLVLDARFEIHRYLDNVSLGIEGDTQFFLRYWFIAEDDAGQTT